MKRRVYILTIIALFISLFIVGCGESDVTTTKTETATKTVTASQAEVTPLEIQVGCFLPPNAPPVEFLRTFGTYVEEYSNGEISIEILGPDAIPAGDMGGALSMGTVDMIFAGLEVLPGEAGQLVYLNLSEWEVTSLRNNGALDLANEIAADYNFYILGFGIPTHPYGLTVLFLSEPVTKIADLEGLVIGSGGGADFPFMRELGMNPTQIDYGDMYTALERGTVDGYIIGVPGIIDFGLQPVTGAMLDERINSAATGLVVRMDWWNELTQNQRNALNLAVMKLEAIGPAMWDSICEDIMDDIGAAGTVICHLSPEESALFVQTYKEVMWADALEKFPDLVSKLEPYLVNPNFDRLK